MRIIDFKKNMATINELIYFDRNEYLREKTTHPLEINKVIDEAKGLLKGSNQDDTYYLYGVLGNLHRILGQPKEAINYLTFCLDHAVEVGDFTKKVVALIRLGEAFKYDNNHGMALEKFNNALEICEAHQINEYLDFVWQHKGKCLLELERPKDAEKCFVKALELRNSKGNAALIDSTQQAIDLVKEIKE